MKKKIAIQLVMCGLFIFGIFVWVRHTFFVRPQRVIFIILDAARADHFSCYGYPKNTTPRIDAIGRNGVIFKNNFAQATYTYASVPRILFSRYYALEIFQNDAWMWGVKREHPETINKRFDDEQVFPIEILSRHGYRTGLFTQHGAISKKSYLVNNFEYYYKADRPNNVDLNNDTQGKGFVQKLISWIKENKKGKVFLYWHIMFPHSEYPIGIEQKQFFEKFNLAKIRAYEKLGWDCPISNLDEIECLQGLYDSSLAYADTLVGEFFSELKREKLLNSTFIIITSDHGENIGQHGSAAHGGPSWDSLIHIPLIMYYPPIVPKGVIARGLTESIDIIPTILDICKIKLPRGKSFDGESLINYMRHPNKGKEYVISEGSIRSTMYKYFIKNNLLFNLKVDPGEENNISAKEYFLANKMKELYLKITKPYRIRYENSTKKSQIDYPFYLLVSTFKIIPANMIFNTKKSIPLVEEIPELKTKTWILSDVQNNEKLVRIPHTILSSPITLSSFLINGRYKVSLLFESPIEMSLAKEQFTLFYRFNNKDSFKEYSGGYQLFRKRKSSNFYYLDLGDVLVENNKFILEIDFLPLNKQLYSFWHVKFSSQSTRNGENYSDPHLLDEEFQKKREELRALGYLQ